MQKLIVLSIYSFLLSWNVEGHVGVMGQWPKGELKIQEVPTGWGLDLNGIGYPVDQLGFGLNVGYGQYGSASRQVPFNYFSPGVTIEEKTTNSIGHGHVFFRFSPFNKKWTFQPYCEGLIGLKHFSTKTAMSSNNCVDNLETDHDDCEIASSTNASDFVFSYGWGVGLDIELTQINNKNNTTNQSTLYFFINGRYLWGGEAQYLKEGGIEYSDPNDGPVQAYYNWQTSTTDIMQFVLGLGLKF